MIMKTRKVTRKTLEELAKIMPVLTEQEQRSCKGGAMFINIENGEELGRLGPSSMIRVCTQDEFNNFKGMADSDNTIFESQGQSFKSMGFASSGAEGAALMKQIVQRLTGYQGGVSPNSGYDEKMGFALKPNNTIDGLVYDPSYEYLYNYDTLSSMLYHEKTHYGTGGGGSGVLDKTLDNTNEDDAYLAQCNQTNFLQLPYGFRKDLAKGWLTSTSKYSKSDIATKTGVSIYDF